MNKCHCYYCKTLESSIEQPVHKNWYCSSFGNRSQVLTMFDSYYWRYSNTSPESSWSIAVVPNEHRKREWSWCLHHCRYTNMSKVERHSLTTRTVSHRVFIEEKTLEDWPVTSKSTSGSPSNCFIWKGSAAANIWIWRQTCHFLRCFHSLLTDHPPVTCGNQRHFFLFIFVRWLSLIDWVKKTRSEVHNSVFSLNIRNELDWASNDVFRFSFSRTWKAIK